MKFTIVVSSYCLHSSQGTWKLNEETAVRELASVTVTVTVCRKSVSYIFRSLSEQLFTDSSIPENRSQTVQSVYVYVCSASTATESSLIACLLSVFLSTKTLCHLNNYCCCLPCFLNKIKLWIPNCFIIYTNVIQIKTWSTNNLLWT